MEPRPKPTRRSSRRTLAHRTCTLQSRMLVFRSLILLLAACVHLQTLLPSSQAREAGRDACAFRRLVDRLTVSRLLHTKVFFTEVARSVCRGSQPFHRVFQP